jgi:membrane associated rhomboid family serine protease
MFPVLNTAPSRSPPLITWALIAANSLVFLYEWSLSPDELEAFLRRFALIPALFFTPNFDLGYALSNWGPFFTNMFLHGGWLHLIFNMWALWLFGGTVEDRMGPARYLVFYLACGFLASVAHAVANPESTEPALGASGAIAGVMGCYMRLFPWARIVTVIPVLFFPFFFELPALVVMGFWFGVQVLNGAGALFTTSAGGGIAYWAHIGGFLAGLLFGPLCVRAKQRYRPYYADEGVYGFDRTGRRRSSPATGGEHAYL